MISGRPRSRPHALLGAALLAALLTVCAIAFAGTGAGAVVDGQYAHGNGTDASPPEVANGTKIDDTTVALTITDNHDVAESSIEAADFLLSTGSVQNISVSEDGPNATATLSLDSKLRIDELTVVIASGATILDTNGNELNSSATNSFAVIENMDGVAPSLAEFSVTNATGSPATIRIAAREALGGFNMTVSGPTTERLDISDFEEARGSSAWETRYSPPTDGTYGVYLKNYTDTSGNSRVSSRNKRFVSDITPPRAVASLDLANSRNLSIAFDARQSSDASGIERYRWTFGDGETATGPRVTHDYLPGTYTATLNVTDIYGNSATDSVRLNLTTGSGNVTDINDSQLRERAGNQLAVSVERPGDGTTDDALVNVDNARRNESVAVGTLANGSALAANDAVSLDGMRVTLSTTRSFDLGLSVAGNGSVSDAAAAGRVPIGGFTVVNTVADENITNATIAFSVARDRLDTLGVTPENVSLYRFHDGSWNRAPTTPLNATNGRQSFTADTPGFSRFAVAASVPTAPDFAVTDATLDTQRVAPGDPFSVTATVENTGTGDGTFRGALEANGTVVASGTTAVAAGETATLTISSETTDTGTYALSVNGTASGPITVAAARSDTGATDDGTAATQRQFVVTDASLGSSRVAVDEPFTVNATVENRGDERGAYTAALAVNGSVVTTKTRPIPAGEALTLQFNYLLNRSGEFPVSVNGTSAGTLTVGDTGEDSSDGGGGLLAPLSGLLGVLPLGLVRPLVLFVVAPVVGIYGILKALAIYLGY